MDTTPACQHFGMVGEQFGVLCGCPGLAGRTGGLRDTSKGTKANEWVAKANGWVIRPTDGS